MDTVTKRRRNKLHPDPKVRAAILAAATEIVREEGVGAASVANVLAKAQLSTRAFYRHFDSKDALVSAVFLELARAETRRIKRKMAAVSTPEAAVAAWIDARLDLAFNDKIRSDLRTLSVEAQTQMFAAPHLIGDAYLQILEPLVEQLERGVESGVFPGIDPAAAALSVSGVIWSCTERQWATGNADFRAVRDNVVRFCMRGLGITDRDGR